MQGALFGLRYRVTETEPGQQVPYVTGEAGRAQELAAALDIKENTRVHLGIRGTRAVTNVLANEFVFLWDFVFFGLFFHRKHLNFPQPKLRISTM